MDSHIFKQLLLISFICIVHVSCRENSTATPNPANETVHLYLLAIPESTALNAHLHKYRQDDEDIPAATFAETSNRVGQIIQGVLGGDFRPIFAGSVKFVEEPMAQQNLNSFFGTIAPALNLALREVYTRVRTRFGFRPIPTSTQATPQKQSQTQAPAAESQPLLPDLVYGNINSSLVLPSDYAGGNGTGNKTVSVYHGNDLNEKMLLQQYAALITEQKLLEQQLLQLQLQQLQQQQQQLQQQQLQQEQEQEKQQPPTSTTSWQYVLNQINTFTTTTVEPLPFLNLRTTLSPGGDDDDDGRSLESS